MERELRSLGDALATPKRPFVAVLGGAKISGNIDVIQALLPKVDEILIGAAMASTFFVAIGFGARAAPRERDKEDLAHALLPKASANVSAPRCAAVHASL